MDKLSALNVVGVTSIALLAAVSAGLAVQGYAAGTAYPIPALPQWALLGPTRLDQIEALTAVIPVLIACYVAHQSVHPLMPLVQPYSDGKMRQVIAVALLIAFGVYFTLAVGASLAFGPDVQVGRWGCELCIWLAAVCLLERTPTGLHLAVSAWKVKPCRVAKLSNDSVPPLCTTQLLLTVCTLYGLTLH